jgi:hypothetical protein
VASNLTTQGVIHLQVLWQQNAERNSFFFNVGQSMDVGSESHHFCSCLQDCKLRGFGWVIFRVPYLRKPGSGSYIVWLFWELNERMFIKRWARTWIPTGVWQWGQPFLFHQYLLSYPRVPAGLTCPQRQNQRVLCDDEIQTLTTS